MRSSHDISRTIQLTVCEIVGVFFSRLEGRTRWRNSLIASLRRRRKRDTDYKVTRSALSCYNQILCIIVAQVVIKRVNKPISLKSLQIKLTCVDRDVCQHITLYPYAERGEEMLMIYGECVNSAEFSFARPLSRNFVTKYLGGRAPQAKLAMKFEEQDSRTQTL